MDDIQRDAQQLQKEVDQFESELTQYISLQEKALHHIQDFEVLAKMVAVYEQRLGMRFVHTGCVYSVSCCIDVVASNLKVIFTMIDPKDPRREFSFVINVDSNNLYRGSVLVVVCVTVVTDVRPPLSKLESLVNTLNTDKNLGSFVKVIRRKFKELV